jgi:hypothetical protein
MNDTDTGTTGLMVKVRAAELRELRSLTHYMSGYLTSQRLTELCPTAPYIRGVDWVDAFIAMLAAEEAVQLTSYSNGVWTHLHRARGAADRALELA